jgi:caffeoyl-CoA O-methyltransferase/O-methyltransferase
MLPDQQEYAHLYTGDNLMKDLFSVVSASSGIQDPHEEFKLEQSDLFTVEEMASNPIALRFLQFIITVANVKRVLEIGAFIGLSTMSFAKALPEGGEVVSLEKFDKFAAIARKNFELNGLSDKIKLHQGDAFDIVDTLPKDQLFDMIFVDGNKERYKDYVVKTEHLLSPRGIMIVDDCFYHGDVLNKTTSDPKGKGTADFMTHAAGLEGWLRIALPLSNGIFMMIRDPSQKKG